MVEKKEVSSDWGKLSQGLLIFGCAVTYIIAKYPLMYRRASTLFEIVVKIGKDFLTN